MERNSLFKLLDVAVDRILELEHQNRYLAEKAAYYYMLSLTNKADFPIEDPRYLHIVKDFIKMAKENA